MSTTLGSPEFQLALAKSTANQPSEFEDETAAIRAYNSSLNSVQLRFMENSMSQTHHTWAAASADPQQQATHQPVPDGYFALPVSGSSWAVEEPTHNPTQGDENQFPDAGPSNIGVVENGGGWVTVLDEHAPWNFERFSPAYDLNVVSGDAAQLGLNGSSSVQLSQAEMDELDKWLSEQPFQSLPTSPRFQSGSNLLLHPPAAHSHTTAPTIRQPNFGEIVAPTNTLLAVQPGPSTVGNALLSPISFQAAEPASGFSFDPLLLQSTGEGPFIFDELGDLPFDLDVQPQTPNSITLPSPVLPLVESYIKAGSNVTTEQAEKMLEDWEHIAAARGFNENQRAQLHRLAVTKSAISFAAKNAVPTAASPTDVLFPASARQSLSEAADTSLSKIFETIDKAQSASLGDNTTTVGVPAACKSRTTVAAQNSKGKKRAQSSSFERAPAAKKADVETTPEKIQKAKSADDFDRIFSEIDLAAAAISGPPSSAGMKKRSKAKKQSTNTSLSTTNLAPGATSTDTPGTATDRPKSRRTVKARCAACKKAHDRCDPSHAGAVPLPG